MILAILASIQHFLVPTFNSAENLLWSGGGKGLSRYRTRLTLLLYSTIYLPARVEEFDNFYPTENPV